MADDVISMPGEFSGSVISPLYADRMPLDSLNDALRLNEQSVAGQRQSSSNRFWSTPPRPIGDTTRDVLEVNLSVARRINSIAFELAHFPQDCAVEFYDDIDQAWLPVLTTGGVPTVITIVSSVPSKIATAVIQQTHRHPQHFGAGHWVPYTVRVRQVVASRFRFVLTRPGGQAPVNSLGQSVPYSLGVRSVNIGYRVRDRLDVPRRRRVTLTESEDFTTSTDLLGSSVKFLIRENKADNILSGGVWKCEPQPVSYAVVNFYVDSRDADGNPQVIDRFFIDPTHSGPTVNIYSSDESPDGNFVSSDEPISFPVIQAHGAQTPGYSRSRGITFANDISYIDIDNQGVQWNIGSSWWMAFIMSPQFNSGDLTIHRVLDAGLLKVNLTTAGLEVVYGSSAATLDVSFTVNQQIAVLIALDAETGFLSLAVVSEGRTTALLPVEISATIPNASLRLGGARVGDGEDPGVGNYTLNSLVLKQGAFATTDFDAYVADPAGYNIKTENAHDPDSEDLTDNALLRMDPSFMTPGDGSFNQAGFVGGPGDRFATMTWTPVNRDFKLHRGFFFIDPTSARFFKFEFTDLTPEPYETFTPINRKVKVFASVTVQDYLGRYNNTSQISAGGGIGAQTNQNLSTILRYEDDVASLRATQSVSRESSTETLYSKNPDVAAKLRDQHYLYGFQKWHPGFGAPRFIYVQKHFYETIEVKHTSRVAYFVGLKTLSMYRLDYTTNDDTEQYLELFHDDANIASSSWVLTKNDLSTESSGMAGVSTTSKVFQSQRRVTGVQFATTQSPPEQLLPDPDFNDVVDLAARWGAYGAANDPESTSDYNTDIGTTVKVQRTTTGNFWNNIELHYPTWDDTAGLTWDDLEGDPTSSPDGGIQSLDFVDASAAGRLYAAVRVIAPHALHGPLWVQIVSQDGTVLSEAPMDVKGGQVTEWYTNLTISEAAVASHTWDDIQALYPTWDDTVGQDWNDLEASPAALLGPVGVRLIQKVPTNDFWYVDTLSLYDDGIVWEFSNDGGDTFYPVFDIKNDPNGIFMFPDIPVDAEVGVGRQLVWRVTGYRPDLHINALTIRPWYGDLLSGVAPREAIQAGGPNINLYDHYQPVDQDPRFKMWHQPIPQDWFFFYRQWLMTQHGNA